MRKPSAKTRRAAIEALELAASRWDSIAASEDVDVIEAVYETAKSVTGWTKDVDGLIHDAWGEFEGTDRDSIIAAMLLLRTGWSPGEPVVQIGGSK